MEGATPDPQRAQETRPPANPRKSLLRHGLVLLAALAYLFIAFTAMAVAASLFFAFFSLLAEAVVAGLRALAG